MQCELDGDEFQLSADVRWEKGFDEMEQTGLSQPIKTFTCIICGLSNGPVLYYGECVCVCVCMCVCE